MGQLLLPLFPEGTEMITLTLGVRKQGGTVYYVHSGMPIYSHGEHELNKVRYITSNLILQELCKNCDISRVFHVSADSVRRYKKCLTLKVKKHFSGKIYAMVKVISYCQFYYNAYRTS